MRRILNSLISRLWTKAVDRTAYSASAVALICQAMSSCKSSGPDGAASFDLDWACNGFSADLVLSWIRLWPVVMVVFPRACQKDIVFGVAME